MKTQIRRFLLWLLSKLGEKPIIVPQEVLDLVIFAKPLCERQDARANPGTSGEWKRDRVFEQILNTFPNIAPRHIYLAILLARMP